MRPGALIDYRLRLHGLRVHWQTIITIWEPPCRFVDEQRRGPYRQCLHEHRLTPTDDGTLCEDVVRYAVTGGELVHRLFVRRDNERIFTYRVSKLATLFGGARDKKSNV